MRSYKCPDCGETSYTAVSEEMDRTGCPHCGDNKVYPEPTKNSILPSDKADKIVILLFIAGLGILSVFLALVQLVILTR